MEELFRFVAVRAPEAVDASAAMYGANGIKAPGEPYFTMSKSFKGTKDDKGVLNDAADDLKIETGWELHQVVVQGTFNGDESEGSLDGNEYLQIMVGNMYFVFGVNDPDHTSPDRTTKVTQDPRNNDYNSRRLFPTQGGQYPATADGGTLGPGVVRPVEVQYVPADTHIAGALPIAIETREAKDYAATVMVTCRRTQAVFEEWQATTFNTIMTARATLQSDYSEQTFAASRQSQPSGPNPDANRLVERDELKKACLALLMGTDLQYWEKRNASGRPWGGSADRAPQSPLRYSL